MLFKLIQQLDKSEKRYFVLLTAHYKEGDSHYIRLYNYIVEQEVYDDKVIKAHFKAEAWVANYTIVKRYLYEKLLKALRFFHEDKFERAEFTQMYQNIQIFEWKGLTKNLEKEQRRLEKYLQQTENWMPERIIYSEYIAQQIQLQGKSSVSEQGHEEWYKVLDDFGDVAQNLVDYIDLRKASLKMRKGLFCKEPELIDEVMKSPMFQEMNPNYDFRAKLLFNRNFFFYYYSIGESEKSLDSLKKMLDLFEEHPEKKASFKEYNYTLSTYLNNLLAHKKFDDFDTTYPLYQKFVKGLSKSSDKYQAEIISYFLMIVRHLKVGEYDKAIPIFQKGIKKFKVADISTYLSDAFAINFYALGCRIYLNTGKYAKIIDIYNLIDESVDIENWLQGGIHLHFYQMIAMYKFQHKYFLNELKKKIYFFRKHKYYKGTAKLFCDFLKELYKYEKPTKKQAILEKYRKLFVEQKDQSLLSFTSWIDKELEEIGNDLATE